MMGFINFIMYGLLLMGCINFIMYGLLLMGFINIIMYGLLLMGFINFIMYGLLLMGFIREKHRHQVHRHERIKRNLHAERLDYTGNMWPRSDLH